MDHNRNPFASPQDLRQFAALHAVATTGSISQAGKMLGWSDTTINYHLAALERLVAGKLLERSKRGSTLTPLATELLPAATAALNMAKAAITAAQNTAQGAAPLVKFGAFPTAAAQLLPRITRHLRKTSFKLQAHLHEVVNLNKLVSSHSLDAALSYTTPLKPFDNNKYHVTHVLTDPLMLAVPRAHRYASSVAIGVTELLQLANENWILGSSSGDPIDDALLQIFAAAGKTLNITVSTDDYTVALGLVAAGLAVGLVPQLACQNPPAGLKLVPVKDTRLQRDIVLLAPQLEAAAPNAVNQRLQQLTSAVQSAAAELHELTHSSRQT